MSANANSGHWRIRMSGDARGYRGTRSQNDCDRDRLACSAERIAGDYRALCIWNGADHAQDYTDDCVRSRVDRTGVGSESRD